MGPTRMLVFREQSRPTDMGPLEECQGPDSFVGCLDKVLRISWLRDARAAFLLSRGVAR